MTRLKEYRERAELSQAKLADISGVKQQTISLIESGERPNPGIETVAALARALGCTLDELHVDVREERSDD